MAELFKFFWFFGSLGGWKSIHQNFKCQLLKASRCSRTFDTIYVIDNCVLFHISCGLKCYLISASSMQGFLLFALIEWMDFHLGWMDFHLVCLVWMDFHPGWMDFQTSGRSSIKMDGFPSGVDGFPLCYVTSLFGPIGFHSGFKTQIFQLGPFLDPPTLKVQYFLLVQPIVKTKSVLKSPCT